MIRSLFRRLFVSEDKENRLLKNLKANPYFKTTEEKENNKIYDSQVTIVELEKGEIQSISMPDLGDEKDSVLAKHYFKVGDIVKYGDVLCDIETDKFTLEFESYFKGKIVFCCELNKKMTIGTVILKLEGI